MLLTGTRTRPTCGCSAEAVELLDGLEVDFTTMDIGVDPELRAAATRLFGSDEFPQLVVEAKAVGGLAQVKALAARGALALGTGETLGPPHRPRLRLSQGAAAALEKASALGSLRIDVDVQGQARLEVGPPGPADVIVGHTTPALVMDVVQALRIQELTFDVVGSPGALVVRLHGRVHPIDPEQVQARLEAGDPLELVDARSPAARSESPWVGALPLSDELLVCLRRLRPPPLTVVMGDSAQHGQRHAESLAASGVLRVCWLTRPQP